VCLQQFRLRPPPEFLDTPRFCLHIMSKLLDNGSMTLRMSMVGQTLTRSSAQRAKVNVLEFLSSNPELYEKLWELMDTDLIWGLLASKSEKKLPGGCVRISLIPKAIKMQIVRHLGLMITRQQWCLMKKKDRNVVDKLIQFATQLEKEYPIRGGSTVQSIKEFFLGYSKVVQSGLDKLDIDDQGSIDWQNGGVYAFAKKK
jgi:hypothetical protein